MIDLTEELLNGPLSSEFTNYIAINDIDSILSAFNRKDNIVRGKLTVHDVKQYISLLSLRTVFLDSTSLACREFNLALQDFLISGFDLSIQPIYNKIVSVLDAIVAESTIPQFTEEHKNILLSLGNRIVSRTEQLGVEITYEDIYNTLFDKTGNRKL